MTPSNARPRAPRAFSLIGLLVTMACIVLLMTVLSVALNKAVTGEGSAQSGTVRSLEDSLKLVAITQAMTIHGQENDGRYLVPSILARSGDRTLDTTASLFSAIVALQYLRPQDLISGNEYSGYVEPCYDYDFTAYAPVNGRFWDSRFKADLRDLSHVSFAPMPLCGDRLDKQWQATMSSSFPVFGNRGPKDGIHDPRSATYGRDGTWGGHLAFGDTHVEFVGEFTLAAVVRRAQGAQQPDNVFAMEEGPRGGDAILAFTKKMGDDGPQLQWD